MSFVAHRTSAYCPFAFTIARVSLGRACLDVRSLVFTRTPSTGTWRREAWSVSRNCCSRALTAPAQVRPRWFLVSGCESVGDPTENGDMTLSRVSTPDVGSAAGSCGRRCPGGAAAQASAEQMGYRCSGARGTRTWTVPRDLLRAIGPPRIAGTADRHSRYSHMRSASGLPLCVFARGRARDVSCRSAWSERRAISASPQAESHQSRMGRHRGFRAVRNAGLSDRNG